MSIGQIISRVRAERGWTPHRLAREAGIDPAQLSRVERGLRTLTLPTAAKVARALGVSLAVFDGAEWGGRE
jgi:transcriptional regulator with XRE-family HTH domain